MMQVYDPFFDKNERASWILHQLLGFRVHRSVVALEIVADHAVRLISQGLCIETEKAPEIGARRELRVIFFFYVLEIAGAYLR